MTFPTEVSDHHKANLVQKCVYLVAQFKSKDQAQWEKYSEELKTLKPEDSWDFYHMLLVEYQKLSDNEGMVSEAKATVGKIIKNIAAKVVKEVATKKAPVKKDPPAKKPAKKDPPKKTPAKKEPPKKAPVKKTAKKAVKKAPAKKAAPKKAAKKTAVKKAAPKKAAKKVSMKAKKR